MALYEWLLIDADGTLFDYDRAEAEALAGAFAEFNVNPASHVAETYREINGWIWRAFERGEISQADLRIRRFEKLFAAVGVRLDATDFSRAYLEHLSRGAHLIDGAESVVRALRSKVRLLLLTNGLADVQRPRLARSAIRGLFDDVVISEEVGVAKPDERIFDICFARMGHPERSSVLMVGDSLTSDIRGGIEYDLATCWFNPKRKPNESGLHPRYEIRTLAELLPIVLEES